MNKDPLIFIKHIKESIEKIENSFDDISKEKFLKDEDLKDATVRRLEIIGEAVKNLPVGFTNKHKQIEWKKIAGMRDKLTHHYFGVDFDKVWNSIKDDIPKLKKEIENLLIK